MRPKVIRTEAEYRAALARIDELMDAESGTPEAEELELWATLVNAYESKHFPIGLPDPIEAIKFRMEQAGLRQKDLAEYMGSESRVSEVLNRKRPLTLEMARRLHEGLGIPAKVLLQEDRPAEAAGPDTGEPQKYPLKEMGERGWFSRLLSDRRTTGEDAQETLKRFFGALSQEDLQAVRLRQHVRRRGKLNQNALSAWCCRVSTVAQQRSLPGQYSQGMVTRGFVRELMGLSRLELGPLDARDLLAQKGVALVILAHLPQTPLDGAAFLLKSGTPVVALTLRYDRIDHFWFSLCHELAHLSLHLNRDAGRFFIDDLNQEGGDPLETEADRWAKETLIPSKEWGAFWAARDFSASSVRRFADAVGVHPAIVAGRVRRETENYRKLSNMVGHGQVRRLFGRELDDGTIRSLSVSEA